MAIDTHVPPPPSADLVKRVRDVLDRDFAEMPGEDRARLAIDLAADLAATPALAIASGLARRLMDPELAARYGGAPTPAGDRRLVARGFLAPPDLNEGPEAVRRRGGQAIRFYRLD